nr:ribonuclease H-like domain-containing protein [Tanacetum cinerariifolium]
MDSFNPQVVAATKLPILNPNEFDLWKMRIEQYFLMTDYSLWEVILNGDSHSPTRIVDGAVQIIAPTTVEQRLAQKNELKAKGTLLIALPDKHQLKFNIHKDAKPLLKLLRSANFEEHSLDDLFNNLKIYEAEVNGSSTSSQNTQNIAFVSSNNTNNTNESVSDVPSVSAASSKATVSTLLNVDSLSDVVIYSFFASQSNSPQLDNEDLKRGHFARECRSLRDNRNKDTPRRAVPVEADEEPTNYALMAYASSGSSSSLGSNNEVAPCSKDTKANAKKASANWAWKPKCQVLDHVSRLTSASMTLKKFDYTDALGRSNVSQMCDKKNNVLFIDIECVVLSSDYKLLDENHVLLRVPRENNIYNVDLKNVVPSGDLTYLFAKATLDESNLWHRRLGHIKFKTMNKLVKGNLVRGLPSKIFENNHTCVACQKGKQNRASWIKREFSVARTPQQNGVAERKNRTLIEATRTMLANSFLPIPFWAKAVNTARYVQNKFDGNADEGFLVGYSANSKAFRVFNSRTRIVQETLHINFLKNKPNVARIGPIWLFDIDTLTKSMNYQPVVTWNQHNDNAGIKENLVVDPQNTDADVAFNVKENKNDVHVSPSESDKTDNKKYDDKATRDDKGKSPVDSPTGVRDLRAEFEEFSFNSTNRVNAVSAPVNADGPNPTNSTNNFNTTSPFDTSVSPNFRIARKSSFVDPSIYPDDPDMHELEDIVYSDDKEDVGAEADLSNLETYIPVRPILTTRVHKDHPVTQIIGDLTSAPQTRSMTRMVKEQGFEDPDYPDKVYKVVKALYGLHQALRAWYKNLANYLLNNGFQRGKIDQTLFIRKQKGDILLVQVYVDDIIFGSTNKELCKAFEK